MDRRAVGFQLVPALLTPFTPTARIDQCAAEAHLEFLLDHDVDGVLVAGTTGEGPLLDDEELEALTALVVRKVERRARVIVQVGRPATAATVRLAKRAVAAGADQIAVATPFYYRLSQDELERHFTSVLGSIDTPVMAYNIPSRTVNDLEPTLVETLAGAGLAGLKDSTLSLERHLEYLAVRRRVPESGLQLYVGSDALMLEAMRHGSDGIVSVLSNAVPELHVQLRAAHLAGDTRKAQDTAVALTQLRSRLDGGVISGVKQLVAEKLRARGSAYPTALRAPLAHQ